MNAQECHCMLHGCLWCVFSADWYHLVCLASLFYAEIFAVFRCCVSMLYKLRKGDTNKLGQFNQIALAWMSGHSDVEGN